MTKSMIPVVTPLASPEETTWGASGGEEALCCEYLKCIACGGGGVLDYSLGSDEWREHAVSVYDDGKILIHEPVGGNPECFDYEPCEDIASAIRFAARVT
jgi:hypothetical protein